MAGLVGVPWQDIARNPSNLKVGFKSAAELSQSGTWDAILGDPASGAAPTSPYMIESIGQRAGVAAGNAVNGGERTILESDDLQYACTFPLLAPRDCSNPALSACDCFEGNDNPLCAPNPNDGGKRTLQVAAKAYPSTRMLSVIKGIGDQGVLTSVCPAQLSESQADDFAYRPVIKALAEWMAPRL